MQYKCLIGVYERVLCNWRSELKVFSQDPIKYKAPLLISVHLLSFSGDHMFGVKSSRHRETLPVVPPPSFSSVDSSYTSAGPASSSLTPVLPASARVMTRAHGCGVWSGERFKDTQPQTLHTHCCLSLSLSVYCFDPAAQSLLAGSECWLCCTLQCTDHMPNYTKLSCHSYEVDSSNSSGLLILLYLFFFKFFTALQLFVFLPISFYLAAMQPNGHGFMVKVQILNSVSFLKLTLFT